MTPAKAAKSMMPSSAIFDAPESSATNPPNAGKMIGVETKNSGHRPGAYRHSFLHGGSAQTNQRHRIFQ